MQKKVGWVTALGVLWLTTAPQGVSQSPRTPLGDLWAGTRFHIHATLSVNSAPAARSETVPLTVDQFYVWDVLPETPVRYFTQRTSEAWVRLQLRNRGNGWDQLQFRLDRFESAHRTPWRVAELWESAVNAPDRATRRRLSNGQTTPLPPGASSILYVHLVPPSNFDTDGIITELHGSSMGGNFRAPVWDFGAGIERDRAQVAHRLISLYNYLPITPPLLSDGYVWWVARSGDQLRLQRSQHPLHRTSGFVDVVQARLLQLGGTPAGVGAFAAGRCFIARTDGRIGFFPMPAPSENTLDINFSLLNPPAGLLMASSSPMASDGATLYYVATGGQLVIYQPSTNSWSTYTPSSPITTLLTHKEYVLATHWNRTITLWRQGTLLFAETPLPANVGGVTGLSVSEEEAQIGITHGPRISVYHLNTQQWLWSRDLGTTVASNPVYDPSTRAYYCLDDEGRLWGLNATEGAVLRHYPYWLYPKRLPIAQARLQVAVRADRTVSYLYITTLRGDDATTRFWWVNAHFPYNRFFRDIPWRVLDLDSVTVLGNSPNDAALVWFRRIQDGSAFTAGAYLFDLQ